MPTGSGSATDTYRINVSGNAATATTANNGVFYAHYNGSQSQSNTSFSDINAAYLAGKKIVLVTGESGEVTNNNRQIDLDYVTVNKTTGVALTFEFSYELIDSSNDRGTMVSYSCGSSVGWTGPTLRHVYYSETAGLSSDSNKIAGYNVFVGTIPTSGNDSIWFV